MLEDVSLLELVREADRVLVVAGHSYDARHRDDNDVIGQEDDSESIGALTRALDAVDADDAALMTPGGPSVVFLRDRQPLAVVTFLSPNFVRCSQLWTFDRRLRSPESLTRWLTEHGMVDA